MKSVASDEEAMEVQKLAKSFSDWWFLNYEIICNSKKVLE